MHVQVHPGMVNTYDLIEGISLLLKVSLKDKQPPLTVTFQLPEKEEHFVEGHYSTEFREPRPGLGEAIPKVSVIVDPSWYFTYM
jgi:hypothetical protein